MTPRVDVFFAQMFAVDGKPVLHVLAIVLCTSSCSRSIMHASDVSRLSAKHVKHRSVYTSTPSVRAQQVFSNRQHSSPVPEQNLVVLAGHIIERVLYNNRRSKSPLLETISRDPVYSNPTYAYLSHRNLGRRPTCSVYNTLATRVSPTKSLG